MEVLTRVAGVRIMRSSGHSHAQEQLCEDPETAPTRPGEHPANTSASDFQPAGCRSSYLSVQLARGPSWLGQGS